MSLKYYDARAPIRSSPKDKYRKDLQNTIDKQFTNAANYTTIEQEDDFGLLTFSDIGVRLDHIISSESGQKLGDDYRKIIFQDDSSQPINGKRYRFANNIWITVNTKNYEYYTTSSTVLRCNNTINWLLDNGAIHKEPIAINNNLSASGFEIRKHIDVQDGVIRGVVQYNDFTKNIVIDDRFLIGAGGGLQAWKVRSVNTTAFQETLGTKPQFIVIEFLLDILNKDLDDLDNKVAGSIDKNYTISIDQGAIENSIGFNTTLTATVKLNGTIVNVPIEWSSNDDNIATVNSSTGEVDLINIGSTTIQVNLLDNPTINDNISVDVVAIPTPTITPRISPNVTHILQGRTQDYSVYLYDENNSIVAGAFTIVGSNVPSENYTLEQIDGNNFSITNLKQYTTNDLLITCTSGIYVIDISIELRGAW